MDLWITDYKSSGWPEHTTITIQATDGKNGALLTGKVPLAMRKGNDAASDAPIDMGGGNHLEADFKNGKAEIKDLNLKAFADAKFDTLIIDAKGRNIPRTFRSSLVPGSPAPAAAKKETPITIHLRTDDPLEVRDAAGKLTGYAIQGYATACRGKEQYSDKPVEFLVNGDIVPNCPRKLNGGKANYSFDVTPGGPAGNGKVHLGVRIEGTSIEDIRWDIKVPVEKQEKKEVKVKTLTASYDRGTQIAADTMRYKLTLWAQCADGSPVGGKTPTWKTDADETPVAGLTDSDTGLIAHTVDVVGLNASVDYQAFLRKDGVSSNVLPLKGVKKPEPRTYAIEVELDTPHPVGGKFIVVGTTKVDNKLASVECIISSSPDAVAGVEARLGKIEPGSDPNTYKYTSSGGKLKLAVPAASVSSDYTELEITAPDGTSAVVPIVKP